MVDPSLYLVCRSAICGNSLAIQLVGCSGELSVYPALYGVSGVHLYTIEIGSPLCTSYDNYPAQQKERSSFVGSPKEKVLMAYLKIALVCMVSQDLSSSAV